MTMVADISHVERESDETDEQFAARQQDAVVKFWQSAVDHARAQLAIQDETVSRVDAVREARQSKFEAVVSEAQNIRAELEANLAEAQAGLDALGVTP